MKCCQKEHGAHNTMSLRSKNETTFRQIQNVHSAKSRFTKNRERRQKEDEDESHVSVMGEIISAGDARICTPTGC